jgi:hypothetical protein
MSVKMRQHVERDIATATIKGLLDAGYNVSVFDGEETTVKRSTDAALILAAMFTTDEDYLYAGCAKTCHEDRRHGWVRFIYGNDGWDVINDYTVNLEQALTAAHERAAYWEK